MVHHGYLTLIIGGWLIVEPQEVSSCVKENIDLILYLMVLQVS